MLVCWRAPRTSAKADQTTPVPWRPAGTQDKSKLKPNSAGVVGGGSARGASGSNSNRGPSHSAAAEHKTILPPTSEAAPTHPPSAGSGVRSSTSFAYTYATHPHLSRLVYKAAACNLALLHSHNNFRPTGSAEVNLTLHTGLGVGMLSGLYVGGVEGMWYVHICCDLCYFAASEAVSFYLHREYFIGGEPIHQMSEAGEVAASGEVMLSPQCYELIKGWVTAGSRHSKSQNFSLQGLADAQSDPAVRHQQAVF
jgi:hypothetical protein